MSKKILLIEPSYKNKYPPLGLMKIATYHKSKGHEVVFFKGCSPNLKLQVWDRIYISTLFTFYWAKTIETIEYYSNSVKKSSNIYVGGVMATLMKDEIKKHSNVTVISGLLNQNGKLGYKDDGTIDYLTPDYSIIDQEHNPLLDYVYPQGDSYIGYATRGCIRKCKFCAVPIIEPEFMNGLSIKKQINSIKKHFGEKRNLLLLDNNILASDRFEEIIEEIKNLGFEKNAQYSTIRNNRTVYLKRYVDFNQGIDARLLTNSKVQKLSEIAIQPIRIAFDDIKFKDIYVQKVRLVAEYGIKALSNYILFNFNDTPEDFYERLRINVELNCEFENKGYASRIWSFPMKYSPIFGPEAKNRKHVGKYWNKEYLRGVQCILLATHGLVGPKMKYFDTAFGRNFAEFKKIITTRPEEKILYRTKEWLNRPFIPRRLFIKEKEV